MVHLIKNKLLNLERLDRLMLNDNIFADALHGVVLVLNLVLDEIDFAKGSTADDTDQFEVIPGNLDHRRLPVQTT